MTAVLFNSTLYALHAIAVHLPVCFCRHGQPPVKIDRVLTIILHANQHETVLRVDIHLNQACLWIAVFLLALNGVINGVSENGADIHDVNEIQIMSISKAGHGDAVFLADDVFAGQQRIQHGRTGIDLRFIHIDRLYKL